MLIALRSAGAQTIRGVTFDAITQLPIPDAIVALLDSAGRDVGIRTRSSTAGSFVLVAHTPGRYRVMATRIGYQPLVSVMPPLKTADLASVRMPMVVLAQQLSKVEIVARRRLTLTDLMSPLGFDVRRAKGFGRTLDSAQLNGQQLNTVQNMLESHIYPNVGVKRVGADSLPIVTITGCEINTVDVFLDGRRMNLGGPDAMIIGHTANPLVRLAPPPVPGLIKAFSFIEALPANTLYGIEIYNRFQLPPPSLGGSIGALDRCALVVWTKAFAERVAAREAAKTVPGMDTRVVWGTITDSDTHVPIRDADVALQTGASRSLGGTASARSDAAGHFLLRASTVQPLQISVKRSGYPSMATASFTVEASEVVAVELAMSHTRTPPAPLTIIARDQPVSVALTSFAGFELRRQRTKSGVFFLQHEIARHGAVSLLDLLGSVAGVTVTAAGSSPSVRFVRRLGDNPVSVEGCAPAFVVDGARFAGALADLVTSTPVVSVRGVEIYPIAADVPPEFAKLVEGCGAVLIWKG
jgi:hypothetical protein